MQAQTNLGFYKQYPPSESELLGIISAQETGRFAALCIRTYPMEDFAQEPAILTSLDRVSVQISGAGVLEHTFEGRFFREKIGPGCICVLPKGFSSAWRVNFTATILHFYFYPGILDPILKGELPSAKLRHVFNGYDPLVEQIGRGLLAELQHSEALSSLYVEALMDTLLIHLVRNYASFEISPRVLPHGLSPAYLQQIKHYLQEHLHQDVTLNKLAAIVGLSVSHFSRQFKVTTGLSPHQYLIRMRVLQAERLLKEGKLTIAEIARRVGFADQSHLSRHFQRINGQTPGAFIHSKNVQKESKNLQDPPE